MHQRPHVGMLIFHNRLKTGGKVSKRIVCGGVDLPISGDPLALLAYRKCAWLRTMLGRFDSSRVLSGVYSNPHRQCYEITDENLTPTTRLGGVFCWRSLPVPP